jgi:hypothetical protein
MITPLQNDPEGASEDCYRKDNQSLVAVHEVREAGGLAGRAALRDDRLGMRVRPHFKLSPAMPLGVGCLGFVA